MNSIIHVPLYSSTYSMQAPGSMCLTMGMLTMGILAMADFFSDNCNGPYFPHILHAISFEIIPRTQKTLIKVFMRYFLRIIPPPST